MTEIIDATSDKLPGFFIIAAMTIAMQKYGYELPDSNPVNVQLLVNGVEIPFTETVTDLFDRNDDYLEREVRTRAAKLVADERLETIRDLLQEVEEKVRDVVDRVPAHNISYQGRLRGPKDRDIMKALDDYIEFAVACNKFADAGVYRDLKEYILDLQSQVADK